METNASKTDISTTENGRISTTESKIESTTSPTARPTETEPTEKETTDDDTTDRDVSHTAYPDETDETETLPNRLEIYYSGEKEIELKIILIGISTEDNVYAERHTLKDSQEINLTETLTDGKGYRIVLEMNDNRIYNRNMYDYDNYVLSVRSDGSVSVKDHVAV